MDLRAKTLIPKKHFKLISLKVNEKYQCYEFCLVWDLLFQQQVLKESKNYAEYFLRKTE